MTTQELNKIKRMMRKVAVISVELEKMAFNGNKVEAAFLYDASNYADIFGRKLDEISNVE